MEIVNAKKKQFYNYHLRFRRFIINIFKIKANQKKNKDFLFNVKDFKKISLFIIFLLQYLKRINFLYINLIKKTRILISIKKFLVLKK